MCVNLVQWRNMIIINNINNNIVYSGYDDQLKFDLLSVPFRSYLFTLCLPYACSFWGMCVIDAGPWPASYTFVSVCSFVKIHNQVSCMPTLSHVQDTGVWILLCYVWVKVMHRLCRAMPFSRFMFRSYNIGRLCRLCCNIKSLGYPTDLVVGVAPVSCHYLIFSFGALCKMLSSICAGDLLGLVIVLRDWFYTKR